MHHFTDEELVSNYLETRSNDYFEQLYTRYCSKVHRTCLSFTHDNGRAEDLTHDIFIRIFTKLDGYKRQATFSTWLYSIAHNYCADQVRKSRRRQEVPVGENWDELTPLADDSMEQQEAAAQLIELAICALSLDEQLLLRQRYEQKLSVRQLAVYHALTESAVKMRLKRSRDHLRDQYLHLAAQ
ncbi:RNA polymerase sigma factor [Spirosoma rigui]|uniref:RNA polymerase sigma factor n=1 Tax=Spirosoma rigui TaxID=564064 RepID=UPI0009B087C6|nr:sigma-70 family RNA polymerase sigma factor [Spirosoma rigui]